MELKTGQTIRHPRVTYLRYAVESRLGSGGTAQVYLVRRVRTGERFCLKLLEHESYWHREAYFGEMLKGNARVVQLLDSFPLTLGRPKKTCFALIFQYAALGSLYDYLPRSGPWDEVRACREICALLKVLEDLHDTGAMHRDLTPMNVLVAANGRIKLADFGIAAHGTRSRPVSNSEFNRYFVSCPSRADKRKYWRAADDIYQIGQLLAMMLGGNAERRITRRDLARIPCRAGVRKVIEKALGPRTQRYPDAAAMRKALRKAIAC